MKLKVNKARFGREERLAAEKNKVEEVSVRGGDGKGGARAKAVAGVSYRNVTTRLNHVCEDQRLAFELAPSEEMMEVLEECHVGFLHVNREVVFLQHCLSLEGLGGISVTAMGGRIILLKSLVPGDIVRAQAQHKVWWSSIFFRM